MKKRIVFLIFMTVSVVLIWAGRKLLQMRSEENHVHNTHEEQVCCAHNGNVHDHDGDQNDAEHAECDHEHESHEDAGHDHEKVEDSDAHAHVHDEGGSCTGCGDDVESFELTSRRENLLGIKVIEARKLSLQNMVVMPGRFEWDQSAVRSYGVPVSGFVDIKVKLPQEVRVGDILFTVGSVELQRMIKDAELAGKAVSSVETEVVVLKQRIQSINASGSRNAELEMNLAFKEAEFEQAEAERDSLKFILKQSIPAEASVEEGEVIVRALCDGFVKKVDAVSGEWCETGREIVRVARSGGLRFKAEALFSDSVGLRNDLSGEVVPAGVQSEESRLLGNIKVGFADDADARVMPVFVEFKELPAWVRPSMPGVLRVGVKDSTAGSVAIPEICVVQRGVDQIVFVADADEPGRYFIRKVFTGVTDGDMIEIKSGVQAGESVVSSGVYQLRQEFALNTGEVKKSAGHFHADGKFHEGEH